MNVGTVAGNLTHMGPNDSEQPRSDREAALLRLKKRRDFQSDLVAFLVVNAAVWVIWLFTGSGYPWPAWLRGGLGDRCPDERVGRLLP